MYFLSEDPIAASSSSNRLGEFGATGISQVPKEGHFYQIKRGDTLLSIVSKAYGVRSGQERLRLAHLLNNDPFNVRLRGSKPTKLFPAGIISFFPNFTCDLNQQITKAGKPPIGNCYAVIKIPSRTQPPATDKPPKNEPKSDPSVPNPLKPNPYSIAPTIRGCTNPKKIEDHWEQAVKKTALALKRFGDLAQMPEAVREGAWNKGQEKIWFGQYSSQAFKIIHWRLRRIDQVLRHPALKIQCRPNLNSYARSAPHIQTISLGRLWLAHPDPDQIKNLLFERTQTFIHEAAHIAGVTNVRERKKYGQENSKGLAKKSPLKARRNADNYGYYVMEYRL